MFRLATEDDAKRIDILRKQTRNFHIKYKPGLFKEDNNSNNDYTKSLIHNEESDILLYEDKGEIVAYIIIEKIIKPENAYRYEMKYLYIDDFGVDESCRHKGIGTKLFEYCKEYAKENGFEDIKLNVWAFNENAFEFYKKLGFNIERYYLDYTFD